LPSITTLKNKERKKERKNKLQGEKNENRRAENKITECSHT
jgi:hypothetical protein